MCLTLIELNEYFKSFKSNWKTEKSNEDGVSSRLNMVLFPEHSFYCTVMSHHGFHYRYLLRKKMLIFNVKNNKISVSTSLIVIKKNMENRYLSPYTHYHQENFWHQGISAEKSVYLGHVHASINWASPRKCPQPQPPLKSLNQRKLNQKDDSALPSPSTSLQASHALEFVQALSHTSPNNSEFPQHWPLTWKELHLKS